VFAVNCLLKVFVVVSGNNSYFLLVKVYAYQTMTELRADVLLCVKPVLMHRDEKAFLMGKCCAILQRFYDSKNHQKKNIQAGS